MAAWFTLQYGIEPWSVLNVVLQTVEELDPGSLPEPELCHIGVDVRGLVEAFTQRDDATSKRPPHHTMGAHEASEVVMYPVHVCVSPLASKRDVLDYVTKNWRYMRDRLDQYGKERRIRARPMSERDRFIWEHRDLARAKLADMVNEEFHSHMEYYDVARVLLKLKKRTQEERLRLTEDRPPLT
jgi:hypothetical protein